MEVIAMTEGTFVNIPISADITEVLGYDLLLLPDDDVQEVIRTGIAVKGVLKFLTSLPEAHVEGSYCGTSGIEKLKSVVNVVDLAEKRMEILQYVDRLVKLTDADFKWLVNYFSPEIDVDEALSMRNLQLSYALLLESV